MHEWSLADAVITTVDKYYKEKNAVAVKSVTIQVGELQNIDEEVFFFGLQNLLDGYPFGEEVFHIEVQPVMFRCRFCKHPWSLSDVPEVGPEEKEAIHFLPESAHVYLKCPSCGSTDFVVETGRGVSIGSIELEVEEEKDKDV